MSRPQFVLQTRVSVALSPSREEAVVHVHMCVGGCGGCVLVGRVCVGYV